MTNTHQRALARRRIGRMHRALGPIRRAFTLIELVMSMTITGLLLGGIASAMLIASHGLPSGKTTAERIVDSADAVERIAAELVYANAFTQATATLVEFTVERLGANHTIRYEWSGLSGDPLTRQYDGGTLATVIDDVREFDLGYATRSVTASETTTIVTLSGEVLLAFFDGWATKTETPQDFGVDSDYWAAQFFSANSIPTDASKVTINRALLKLRQGALAGAGTFSVAIHSSKGGGNPEPRPNPIGTPVVRSASTLSAGYLWEEFVFSDVFVNNANKEKVIVVKGTAVAGTQADAEILRYHAGKAPKIDSNALWTTDGGAKWDPKKNIADDNQFPFYVYGEYETTSTTAGDVTKNYLDSVNIKLRASDNESTRAESTVGVLNELELP